MALIEYTLQKDADGKYSVGCTVIKIDQNDRVQFTSNFPEAAVEYQATPPFQPPKQGDPLPVAGKPFAVPDGNGKAGPFTVTKAVTKAIPVKCGILPGGKPFQSFGVGFDHPTGN